jgi:hypothetical protein
LGEGGNEEVWKEKFILFDFIVLTQILFKKKEHHQYARQATGQRTL